MFLLVQVIHRGWEPATASESSSPVWLFTAPWCNDAPLSSKCIQQLLQLLSEIMVLWFLQEHRLAITDPKHSFRLHSWTSSYSSGGEHESIPGITTPPPSWALHRPGPLTLVRIIQTLAVQLFQAILKGAPLSFWADLTAVVFQLWLKPQIVSDCCLTSRGNNSRLWWLTMR